MSDIIISNVSKTYKSYKKKSGFSGSIQDFFNRDYITVDAVNDLNLHIATGEMVGLLGENGAGKTTTIKLMTGILHSNQGDVKVLGYNPVNREKEFLKSISFVMGNRSQLLWDLPALDSFKYQQKIYEVPQERFEKSLNRLVDILGVEDLLTIQVRRLSLGERMKMEIINSLLHDPKLIFLDEPTIGLDLMSQKNIRSFLNTYNQETKSTIILTSHYMEDIKSTCDRVVILKKGIKIYDDSISEMKKLSQSQRMIQLSFQSEPNFYELEKLGKVVEREGLSVKLIPYEREKEVLVEVIKRFTDLRDISIQEIDFESLIKDIMYGEEKGDTK